MFSSKLWEAFEPFIAVRSCIVTWKVRTSSSLKTCKPNLETLTFPKLSKKVSATHRLVHRIMLVLKFGVICLTTQRVTSGRLDAYCMRCVHWFLLSEPTTCKASTKRLSKANTHVSLTTSVKRWQQLSNLCFRFHQVIVLLATRFSHYQLWRPYLKSFFLKKEIKSRRKLIVTSYWKQFALVEIYFRLQNVCQRTNIEESLMNCYVTIQ